MKNFLPEHRDYVHYTCWLKEDVDYHVWMQCKFKN